MKKVALALIVLAFAACQTSDTEIRADIACKAQQDLNFAGLQYTVQNGVVDFTGQCPSQKALTKIRQTIENIHVIKTVRYHVGISPILLDTLTPLKLQVDSLLAQYPMVTAEVDFQGTTLKGKITAADDKAKLMKAFHLPGIRLIRDSLDSR